MVSRRAITLYNASSGSVSTQGEYVSGERRFSKEACDSSSGGTGRAEPIERDFVSLEPKTNGSDGIEIA